MAEALLTVKGQLQVSRQGTEIQLLVTGAESALGSELCNSIPRLEGRSMCCAICAAARLQ